jgi:Tfp pilus assembly protein FimT
MIETLVVLSLIAISLGYAVSNLNQYNDPLQNGSAAIMGYIKQARARAVARTMAYHIAPSSSTRILSSSSSSCSDMTLTADNTLTLDLPSSTSLPDTSWSLCFTSRGLSDSNLVIDVQDQDGNTRSLEVVLGGAVRVL